MSVYEVDPQQNPEWTSFVESHPRSSVFHTREWLEALRRTYGYRPTVFTCAPKGAALSNGIVFCGIKTWLTGSRLISLPFSDHCDPLVDDPSDLKTLLSAIGRATAGKFKYAEIRPRGLNLEAEGDWVQESRYHFHTLDLRSSIPELYSGLHKDGVQRKIRRAERERVVLDQGRSDLLLGQFYQLLLLTRRRHRLPPQPLRWFRNLVDCLGSRLTIRVASVDDRPIASILTLTHKHTLVYKYGCSDERFHNLGAMPLLFWRAIQDAKAEGLQEFDLGRSDEANSGLVRFKDHLGANRTSIAYWRFPHEPSSKGRGLSDILNSRLIKNLLPRLPDRLFRLAGEIFYRHAA
jgi:CelD/BcsL family acetyltransferase involved in cellulose biosynthesis